MINNQKGQSLVEMIVVIGMVVLLVTGIVVGTTTSLSRSETSQVRSEALSHAQAGIELARKTRDSGWNEFAQKVVGTQTAYCVGSDEIWNEGTCQSPNIDSKFTRSITLKQTGSGISVTTNVMWGNDPNNEVYLITHLTNWRGL